MNKKCVVSNYIADKKEVICYIFLLLFIFRKRSIASTLTIISRFCGL